MSEEAAIYKAENAEWLGTVQGLRAQLNDCRDERDRLESRIRELEDAILLHHKHPGVKRVHDEWLYEAVGYLLWT
jgi:chromosome segregation ATPase